MMEHVNSDRLTLLVFMSQRSCGLSAKVKRQVRQGGKGRVLFHVDVYLLFNMPLYTCASEVYTVVCLGVCLPVSACVCWKQTKNVPYLCLCRLHAIQLLKDNEVK